MWETWVRPLVQEDPLEKEMAIHSSTLAWEIPWKEEPGRLQSMGLRRVGHNLATSLSLFTFLHWRRKWQPTPAFLPGESQGRGSLIGCRLWGRTESDTTEVTWQQQQQSHNKPLVESLFLTRNQAQSFWSRSTDSKTLDNQRTNLREYQIVRTHTKKTT